MPRILAELEAAGPRTAKMKKRKKGRARLAGAKRPQADLGAILTPAERRGAAPQHAPIG
jgi:hypothetical protein